MAAARASIRRRMQEEKEKEKEEKEQQQDKKKKKSSFRNSFKRDKNKPTKTKEQIEKALAKSKGANVTGSPEKPKKSLTDILADLKKEKEKTEKKESEPEKEPLMVKNAGRYSPHNNTKESEMRNSLRSNKSEAYSPALVQQSRNNGSTRSIDKSPSHQKQHLGNNGRTSQNKNIVYQGDQMIPQREREYNRVQRNESRKSQMSRYSDNSNYYYDNDFVRDEDQQTRSRYNSFVDDDEEFVPPERNKPKNKCKFIL